VSIQDILEITCSIKSVVSKLWQKNVLKVVREHACFLFFFTKNIFAATVFTYRVVLINP